MGRGDFPRVLEKVVISSLPGIGVFNGKHTRMQAPLKSGACILLSQCSQNSRMRFAPRSHDSCAARTIRTLIHTLGLFSHRKGGYTCAAHSGMLFEILGIHSGMFFATFGIHSGVILTILDPTVIIYMVQTVSDSTIWRETHLLCVKTIYMSILGSHYWSR